MKKWIALLLALTMVLSMTACGTSEPAPTEAPQVTVEPTEYLPYEGDKLTVLYLSGGPAEAARAMVPEFEALTGATVEVVELSNEELYEETLLDLVSYIGTYDVININSQWDGEFFPYLVPLDDYIAQDNYDMSVWIDNILANCGQWKDTTIGIPTSCMADVFAYRTDLLPNGIPQTWNDYRKVLSPINRPATGMYGIAVSKAPDQALNIFNRVLWSVGGSWADEDWNIKLNSPETRTALNHLHATKKMSDPECLEWTLDDALQAFLDGNAAVCETFNLMDLLQKADDPEQSQIAGNWALGLIPADKTGITTLSAWEVAIPVGSQYKDLAWEWIKMYTSDEMQNKFYDEFAVFSPREEFWEQEKMSDLYVIREALEHANNTWRITTFKEAEPEVTEVLNSFIEQKIFQDPAMRKMDTELKDVMEKMPPEEGIKNYNH